jgi:uncharacterized lipoprotein
MKKILKILMGVMIFSLTACTAPRGFVAQPAGWNAVQMRESVNHEKAWSILVSVVSDDYDIEMMDSESGYLRTNWRHEGQGTQEWFTRIIGKVEMNGTTRIKVESKYYDQILSRWVNGYNTFTTTKIKDDLSGRLM